MKPRAGASRPEARLRAALASAKKLTKADARRFALQLGELLVEGVYGGDPEAWRSRTSEAPSLRTLTNELGGLVTLAELHRILHAYVVWRDTPLAQSLPKLTLLHLYAVRHLWLEDRTLLLERASREGLTATRLEQLGREVTGQAPRAKAAGKRRVSGVIARPRSPSGRGRRVLVVDDERSARYTLRRWLGDAGFSVVECASSAEALAQPPSFELAVIDVFLRGMEPDGIALGGHLVERGITARCVFVSAFVDSIDLGEFERLGPLVDRSDASLLLETIERLLETDGVAVAFQRS